MIDGQNMYIKERRRKGAHLGIDLMVIRNLPIEISLKTFVRSFVFIYLFIFETKKIFLSRVWRKRYPMQLFYFE